MDFKKHIRTVPHFPKKGIMFRDITTLLKDAEALQKVTDEMVDYYLKKPYKIDKVVSAESRGFIFGAILAKELNAGFVPLRKPGKLPAKTIREEFDTEYSRDAFEIHEDAIKKGDKCIICDDLLATGGTSKAAVKLVERLGGEVKGLFFLIELDFLKGKEKLKGHDIFSLINYEKE
ncbi:MAG: adenine phosphoribosyltransferase [Candidatus ainarchaeum sp.]|nr:adenine phosphoribosyltransferase [Candidatus ainarchaeum sp.]